MTISDEVRKLTMTTADSIAIRALAVREGMKTMWDDGREKVAANQTTETELRRVLS